MTSRIFFLSVALVSCFTRAWVHPRLPASGRIPRLSRSSSSESAGEDLLRQAEELWRSAAELEQALQNSSCSSGSNPGVPEESVGRIARWTSLENSSWALTMNLYGFREERSTLTPITLRTKVTLLSPGDDGLAPVQIIDSDTNRYVTKGYVWSVGKGMDDNCDDKSFYLRFNIRAMGLSPVVPDGSLYINARIVRGKEEPGEGAIDLTDGLITFKRPQKTRFLFMVYDGLLAEFKVVGDCSLMPIQTPSGPA